MPRVKMLQPAVQTIGTTRAPALGAARKQASHHLYNYRWQQARKAFLAEHPLCECEDCDAGRKHVTAANVVDHDPPHEGDYERFWDRSTWRAMSKVCHDRKTATRDGGFGNPTGRGVG